MDLLFKLGKTENRHTSKNAIPLSVNTLQNPKKVKVNIYYLILVKLRLYTTILELSTLYTIPYMLTEMLDKTVFLLQ